MCVNKLSTPAECLVAKLKVLLVRLLDKIFKTEFFLRYLRFYLQTNVKRNNNNVVFLRGSTCVHDSNRDGTKITIQKIFTSNRNSMETLLILRFARVRKLRFHRNHKSEITRADTWLLTQNMSSNTYVHMKFESVLSAPIRTVHSRICRRACPCQKNLHENRASHIEVLTRSPRFLYTK